MATGYDYGDFVKFMYQQGFYIISYSISLMSEEVSCIDNKIIISPRMSNDEKYIYVFTGIMQKQRMIGEPTRFTISYLEDSEGNEFRDNDNIMISILRTNSTPADLYTRSYSQWKFGVIFDNGIHLDEDKYLLFQTLKNIRKFDIDITNVDLFTLKPKKEREIENMMWLD